MVGVYEDISEHEMDTRTYEQLMQENTLKQAYENVTLSSPQIYVNERPGTGVS